MSQNTVLTILGRKGSGKSTLAKMIAAEQSRVVIVDANGEYDMGEVCWELQSCIERLIASESERRFCITMRCLSVQDNLTLIGLCYHLENTWLIIDETSLYCSPVSVPDEISRLVRFGRHKEISLVFIGRRASEIPRDITANSDLLISFKQHEPRDIAYLKTIHSDAEGCLTLPDYHFKVFGDMNKAPLAVIERLEAQSA
jgi:hypothetical protein